MSEYLLIPLFSFCLFFGIKVSEVVPKFGPYILDDQIITFILCISGYILFIGVVAHILRILPKFPCLVFHFIVSSFIIFSSIFFLLDELHEKGNFKFLNPLEVSKDILMISGIAAFTITLIDYYSIKEN